MRIILILIVVISLSGCVAMKQPIDPKTYVHNEKPGVGYVFGTVSQAIVDETYSWISIDHAAPGSKVCYRASVSARHGSTINFENPNEEYTVFLFEMPVGRHQVDDYGVGLRSSWLSPVNTPIPQVFDLREGDVLYVGNYFLLPRMGKNLFGVDVLASVIPAVRDEYDADVKRLLKKYDFVDPGRIVRAEVRVGFWEQGDENLAHMH